MTQDPAQGLLNWLKFLGEDDCPCKYDWRSLGMLHGVSMGKGWVRLTTDISCPHHGTRAR